MATIKIKIDERNKAAKGFIEMLKNLSFVKIEEGDPHYDPEFVKKIQERRKSKDFTEVNPDDIWESIK